MPEGLRRLKPPLRLPPLPLAPGRARLLVFLATAVLGLKLFALAGRELSSQSCQSPCSSQLRVSHPVAGCIHSLQILAHLAVPAAVGVVPCSSLAVVALAPAVAVKFLAQVPHQVCVPAPAVHGAVLLHLHAAHLTPAAVSRLRGWRCHCSTLETDAGAQERADVQASWASAEHPLFGSRGQQAHLLQQVQVLAQHRSAGPAAPQHALHLAAQPTSGGCLDSSRCLAACSTSPPGRHLGATRG